MSPYGGQHLPALATHGPFIAEVFSSGDVELVIAAGILVSQPELERGPLQAGTLVETDFTGHVTTLLAAAAGRGISGTARS